MFAKHTCRHIYSVAFALKVGIFCLLVSIVVYNVVYMYVHIFAEAMKAASGEACIASLLSLRMRLHKNRILLYYYVEKGNISKQHKTRYNYGQFEQ